MYAWEGDYQLVPEPLLVAIDMGDITIRRTGDPVSLRREPT
jgi:hypothetical protein